MLKIGIQFIAAVCLSVVLPAFAQDSAGRNSASRQENGAAAVSAQTLPEGPDSGGQADDAERAKNENLFLVSGSRDSGGGKNRNENAEERPRNGDRLLLTQRKHPYGILSCAEGFSAQPAASRAKPARVFFFGDAGGFVSRHFVSETESQPQHQIEMDGIWQISDLPVRLLAPHPDGKRIAVYESDGFSTHRISLWDWETKRRIYAKRFRDSVNSLNWSAAGTFLMVGNTSFEGITVLEGEDGKQRQIFRNSPGMVSMSATGKSERSVVTYAASGRIVYTAVADGETIGEYRTEPDLRAVRLCDNNRTLIGFTDSEAISVSATSGETLASYDAENPVPAGSQNDTVPVWFEKKREAYADSGVWFLRVGDETPVALPLPDGEEITAGAGGGAFQLFGTSAGGIYVSAGAGVAQEKSAAVTPVTGICGFDGGFYFLAGGKLYRTKNSGDAPSVVFDAEDGAFAPQINSIAATENGFLLWSSSAAAPVLFWNGETGGNAAFTELYRSAEGISSLSATENGISFVEGNARAISLGKTEDALANSASGRGNRSAFVYSSAGLQDAVLVSDTYMLVSKSAGIRSPAPLLFINVSTGETVPLQAEGNLCFSLVSADDRRGELYAFSVNSGGNGETKTELIFIRVNRENITRTQIDTVAVYPDEDLTAALLPVSSDRIITTLGKSAAGEIRRRTGNHEIFERSYSLPRELAANSDNIAVLNDDGSISWYRTSDRRARGTTAISPAGDTLFAETERKR